MPDTSKSKTPATETIDDQPDDEKLYVESSNKERSQEATSLTQATTNKTENTDATQQAYNSIIPKPNTIRSGRLVFQPKKLNLFSECARTIEVIISVILVCNIT